MPDARLVITSTFLARSLFGGMLLFHLQSCLVLGSLQSLDLLLLLLGCLAWNALVIHGHDQLIELPIASILIGSLLATVVTLNQK